ncbi:hypothetical protein [Flavobacterium cerinum]|uniref:DUF3108 domain-containing protein n=1 Tax=Flavobacterium cerinum TaxID=2502784 RepID=A0ABY5IRB8_9FLAO|nr:hypothetical protein [Flavobacterium cerinum]UUC44328.1 hypothetical protein NOX80_11865 [Flavobacterium cerinum]
MTALNRLLITFLCITFFSCEKNTNYNLSGTFINKTYLEQSKTALLSDIPFYAVELTFNKDSILFSNGFETGKLAYNKKGNQYLLKKAYQNNGIIKDLIIEATSDSTFTLLDHDYTTRNSDSNFKKSKIAFETALAQNLLEGQYEIHFPDSLKTRKVNFESNGVTNLPGYIQYSICYSGDCMQLVDDKINLITLTNSHKTDFFGWKRGADNTLEFYTVSAPIPDIKGGQKIIEKAFVLKKVPK